MPRVVPLVALLVASVVSAQGQDPSIGEKLDRVLQAMNEMKKENAAKDRRIAALEGHVEDLTRLLQEHGVAPESNASPAATKGDGEKTLPEGEQAFEKKGLARNFGGPLNKPFLAKMGQGTYLGGYMDFDYGMPQDGKSGFEQDRLIPFIYSDISEQVKFATEIEFSHGGPQNNQGNGEVDAEYAFLDFLMKDWANFRGGLILSPLGKLNLVHDSPIQDLAFRPLVDQTVIPTTLTEAGLGFYGKVEPKDKDSLWQLTYEVYLTNGFQALLNDGTVKVDRVDGLVPARGDEGVAPVHNTPAGVGRVAWSPFLGLEFGGSFHVGNYDEADRNLLQIYAFDATWQHGPWEILFEGAWAGFDRNDFARAAGIPEDFWGYYFQTDYHWMPQGLREWWPLVFRPESTFTSVARWDQIDLDGARTERLTLGLNFRHTEKTVFKFDYQINFTDFGLHDDNEWVFGFATYF